MIPRHLHRAIAPILDRANELRRHHLRASYWSSAALLLLGLLLMAHLGFGVTLLILAGVALLGYLVFRLTRPPAIAPTRVLRDIEVQHPDLQALLVTAGEQGEGELNFLQQKVVDEASNEVARRQWGETLGSKQLKWARLWHWAAITGCLLLAISLFGRAFPVGLLPGDAPAGILPAPALAQPAAPVYEIDVTPGNTEAERGSRVTITARFPQAMPESALLRVTEADGGQRNIPLQRNLADPVFGGRIDRSVWCRPMRASRHHRAAS